MSSCDTTIVPPTALTEICGPAQVGDGSTSSTSMVTTTVGVRADASLPASGLDVSSALGALILVAAGVITRLAARRHGPGAVP